MAQRRMFSLSVVDTDRFLELPASSQSLYFHLGIRADDEGFVASPKKITAMVGSATDDLKLLIGKGFIIPFESGVCVITDWKQNNYIQVDRFKKTMYFDEKSQLITNESGSYTKCIQDVSKLDTQVRLGKDSLGKGSQGDISCPASRTKPQDAICEIVAFLNLTIGSDYKPSSKKTAEHISARLREGFAVDDFKTVILKKHAEWHTDPKMSKFLRPETLFGTKFESYLNQPDVPAKGGNPYFDMLGVEVV